MSSAIDSSREQFDLWWSAQQVGDPYTKENMWDCWKASRELLTLKLPDIQKPEMGSDETTIVFYAGGVDMLRQAKSLLENWAAVGRDFVTALRAIHDLSSV